MSEQMPPDSSIPEATRPVVNCHQPKRNSEKTTNKENIKIYHLCISAFGIWVTSQFCLFCCTQFVQFHCLQVVKPIGHCCSLIVSLFLTPLLFVFMLFSCCFHAVLFFLIPLVFLLFWLFGSAVMLLFTCLFCLLLIVPSSWAIS